jgi:hypothetical protein
MNLLVFLRHAGYARNFEWALRLLAERGHRIDVVLEEPAKPDVDDLLNALADEHPNITVEATPQRANEAWCDVSARIRSCLDYLQYLHPGFGDADMPRNRAARRLPGALVTALNLGPVRRPAVQRAVRRLLSAGYRSVPVDAAVRKFIADRRPDAVLISPLIEVASKQADHFDAARDLGIPVGVPIASWDNLHCKGSIHRVPELVTVWNEVQKREAVELHGIPAERVVVTGAVLFDHWYDLKPSRSREAFCEATGLDPARPFVLYVGSGRAVAPGEPDFALRCIRAIREQPGLHDLQVLLRPHPLNPMRGDGASQQALESESDVVIYPPAGAIPVDEQTRADYFDSIYHCSAVLGVITTAFLEATIVDRPVHSVLVGEYAVTQSGTPQFRVMRPESGGMLALADSIEELADQLGASLSDPGHASKRNRMFRERFLRPLGADVAASPRLVEEIERLPAVPRVIPERASIPLRVGGRLLALAVRAYARHKRRRAEFEAIGGRQWQEELDKLRIEANGRTQPGAVVTELDQADVKDAVPAPSEPAVAG